MNLAKYSYQGVGGVSRVSIAGKVEDLDYEEGMAVTLTEDGTVGLGVAGGSPVFGIVILQEIDEIASNGEPAAVTLSVQTSGFFEGVTVNGTVDAGSVAYCNHKGEIVKAPAEPVAGSRAVVFGTYKVDDKTKAVIVL